MQRLEVSGAVRPLYGSLGVRRLSGKVNVIDMFKGLVKVSLVRTKPSVVNRVEVC